MRRLISQYESRELNHNDKIPLTTVRKLMPYTKLTVEENKQIDLIIEWKYSSLWQKTLEGEVFKTEDDARKAFYQR